MTSSPRGGGLLLLLAATACHDKTNAGKFVTAQVERGRLVAKVTATGTLSALVTVQVGAQVSGRIAALLADFNSAVKAGEVIAKLEPQLFTAAVEQARANQMAAAANLAKSQVQAEDMKRQHERARTLREQNLIAQAELDTASASDHAARAQVAASEGALAQAKAALHQAEINLGYTQIRSPVSGIVISRNVDVGQTVAAALQAPTLFTIAEDLKKMQVDTSVAEADVGKLQAGMKATFTVDAYPNERFSGTVRQVRNAPTTIQNVVTYDAVIDVDNSLLKLKPGMTATITFVYAEKDGVLKVPSAALRFRPADAPASRAGHDKRAAEERTLYVLVGEKPEPRTVKAGISDGSNVEIAAGELQAGDKVITESLDKSARPGLPRSPFGRGL